MTALETQQAIREQLEIEVDAITYDNDRDEITAISGVTAAELEAIRSAFPVSDDVDSSGEQSE